MNQKNKKVLDLRDGYTIDEVEELADGRLVKIGISDKSHKNGHRRPATRFFIPAMLGLGAASLVALTATLGAMAVEIEPEEVHVPPKMTSESVLEPLAEVVPDPLEDALIEAALVEQGYFREDVPLSYEEQDFLQTACEEFGVDYHLMLALIDQETNFRNLTGDGGDSYGYTQIQPRWWSGLMEEIGAEDLMDPYDNFRTSCAILSQLTEQYGNVRDALSAYNTGSPGETEYATSILEAAEKWR